MGKSIIRRMLFGLILHGSVMLAARFRISTPKFLMSWQMLAMKHSIWSIQDSKTGKEVRGYEVDAAARKVIEKAGYGIYFIHRTGHSITTDLHGSGAHMDNFETKDERLLLPSTSFSIEPGIYLPGKFGIRSEIDVFITKEGKVTQTGKEKQKEIIAILS